MSRDATKSGVESQLGETGEGSVRTREKCVCVMVCDRDIEMCSDHLR